MHASKTAEDTLADWLIYLESLHPKTIEMGLERIDQVRHALDLTPQFPIIMVGGTNGKGSVCAMLESILWRAGYTVGCYTSPHLLRYNERVRINKKEVDDKRFSHIFEKIDAARTRCEASLTFFEFGTLAAVSLFADAGVDVAILEVGLGGRLDAVNIFEPSCSILTNVDLDHREYLGDTREQIGFEKAAIFRNQTPSIYGDADVPESVRTQVSTIGAHFFQFGNDFGFLKKNQHWDFWSSGVSRHSLPLPALRGDRQLQNASACLAALGALNETLPVSMNAIRQGLTEAVIPGRFQVLSTQPLIILDVAHNPGAAAVLSENLTATKPSGKTFAVFSMLQDKDISGVVDRLRNNIDYWLVSSLHTPRAASVDMLVNEIRKIDVSMENDTVRQFPDVVAAFVFACERAGKNDRICVFGSFYTVSDVLLYLNTVSHP